MWDRGQPHLCPIRPYLHSPACIFECFCPLLQGSLCRGAIRPIDLTPTIHSKIHGNTARTMLKASTATTNSYRMMFRVLQAIQSTIKVGMQHTLHLAHTLNTALRACLSAEHSTNTHKKAQNRGLHTHPGSSSMHVLKCSTACLYCLPTKAHRKGRELNGLCEAIEHQGKRITGIKEQVSRSKHQGTSIKGQASRNKYQGTSIKEQVSRNKY